MYLRIIHSFVWCVFMPLQDKAYGNDPPSDLIPKGATLIFEIELLEINGKKEHEVSNGSGKIINKSMHKRGCFSHTIYNCIKTIFHWHDRFSSLQILIEMKMTYKMANPRECTVSQKKR